MCLILFDAVRACSVGVLHIAGTSNLGFGGAWPRLGFPVLSGLATSALRGAWPRLGFPVESAVLRRS